MTVRSLLTLLAVALLVGCQPSGQTSTGPTPPEDVAEATPPDRSGRDPQSPDTYQVSLDTTEGEIVIEVDRSLAPRGADRFYRLVKEGFFDGARFFRVLPGFVAQFGLSGDPELNAKWEEARIPDDRVSTSNAPGTVTFATSGPNSRTTQLFINYGDNSSLDAQGFSPIGKVVEGMDVAEQFYFDYGENPNQQLITDEGNAYLEREFPELDAISTARVTSENGEPVAEAAETETTESEPAAPAEEQ